MRYFSEKVFIAVLTSFLLGGCLTSEYKEYKYRINEDGSGEGKIRFVNIVAQDDEGKDVSFKDFDELIDDYLSGEKFEEENPALIILGKRLYEEENKLVGEVEFMFNSIDSLGFYRNSSCECGPILYYISELYETLFETNGKYLGRDRDFPIIIWKPETNEFYFKTYVQEDLYGTRSLLPDYKIWKENNPE